MSEEPTRLCRSKIPPFSPARQLIEEVLQSIVVMLWCMELKVEPDQFGKCYREANSSSAELQGMGQQIAQRYATLSSDEESNEWLPSRIVAAG